MKNTEQAKKGLKLAMKKPNALRNLEEVRLRQEKYPRISLFSMHVNCWQVIVQNNFLLYSLALCRRPASVIFPLWLQYLLHYSSVYLYSFHKIPQTIPSILIMANATTAADYLQGDTAIKSTEKYPVWCHLLGKCYDSILRRWKIC